MRFSLDQHVVAKTGILARILHHKRLRVPGRIGTERVLLARRFTGRQTHLAFEPLPVFVHQRHHRRRDFANLCRQLGDIVVLILRRRVQNMIGTQNMQPLHFFSGRAKIIRRIQFFVNLRYFGSCHLRDTRGYSILFFDIQIKYPEHPSCIRDTPRSEAKLGRDIRLAIPHGSHFTDTKIGAQADDQRSTEVVQFSFQSRLSLRTKSAPPLRAAVLRMVSLRATVWTISPSGARVSTTCRSPRSLAR